MKKRILSILASFCMLLSLSGFFGACDTTAHTHNWGEWETAVSPTCTQQGERARICLGNAQHTETKGIDALGHSLGAWTVSGDEEIKPCTRQGCTYRQTRNLYTVTFVTDTVQTVIPHKSAAGEFVALAGITSSNPVRSGYVFKGWRLDTSGTLLGSGFVMPESNVTVRAVWSQLYTVSFVTGTAQTFTPLAYEAGDTIDSSDLPRPLKSGFVFFGWLGLPSNNKMPANDITLTADWINSSVSSVITFETGDPFVTVNPIAAASGTDISALQPVPDRSGYRFDGWYTDPEDSNSLFAFTVMPAAAQTVLYAKWTIASTLPVEFRPDIAPGMYDSDKTLRFSLAAGEKLYYTIDGSQPGKAVTGSTKLYDAFSGIPIYDRKYDSDPRRLSDYVDGHLWTSLGIPTAYDSHAGGGGNYYSGGTNTYYNRGTVVKAVIEKQDGSLTAVWTGSYFVWPNHKSEFNLPIMSISMPVSSLFSSKPGTGIYTNYLDDTLNAMCDVEFFDKDKNFIFYRDARATVGGAYHVRAAKKTLNINMNQGVHNDPVEYSMWGDKKLDSKGRPLTRFQRFRLRGGGNESMQGGFSDPLSQRVFAPLNTDTAGYVPTALFLNGDFWGVYEIREHQTDRFVQDNYGAKRSDVVMLNFAGAYGIPEVREGPSENPNDPFMEKYWDMYEFALSRPTFSDADYREFEETYMNVDTLIDTYLSYMFAGNADWPGNNNRMWCVLNPTPEIDSKLDGRWNMMLHDFDHGFNGGVSVGAGTGRNMLKHMLAIRNESTWGSDSSTSAWSTLYFRRLMTNESFRTRFLNRMIYVANMVMDETRVGAMIDEMAAELAPMRPVNASRWRMSWTLEQWVSQYKSFIWTNKEKVVRDTWRVMIEHTTESNNRCSDPTCTRTGLHNSMGSESSNMRMNGPRKGGNGLYSDVSGVFNSERYIPIPTHYSSLNHVEVLLTTADLSRANATAVHWGFSVPANSETAPATFQESITTWPSVTQTKRLLFFNNSHIKLSNSHPDFAYYEITTGDGSTYTISDREHVFWTGNTPNSFNGYNPPLVWNVRTVYES